MLTKIYKEWRKRQAELNEEGLYANTDCGEGSVREDFTRWAKLKDEISFEEMLKLEQEYENNN